MVLAENASALFLSGAVWWAVCGYPFNKAKSLTTQQKMYKSAG
jgi:hypothetical protein